ncbi:ectoine/hydroxyectoine ABC transporter substrate-binding protein EhuB [Agrobacterium vitis]|uniref:Ectoine/hydroxyectoine ABC transporter substrate-binding protein EhuB n=1 Tax=Agrobacterium vitis TaxID=373 RepID=A0A6L6VG33_AGRVI|nr:ectoine/hydroxyectoine ABC transporter substrate-binding protein EhuB [Agrobacterium vitis]MUZ74753.1 ectoine/hydroxyectoine ABC transporter substrate-binding protein EhuB [Agrobacterium vitis]
MQRRTNKTISMAIGFGILMSSSTLAGPLTDRIAAGEAIRLGFSNEVPSAYTADDGKPTGWVNEITLGVLKKMGYEKIESVQTEWGGLVPGLSAGRFDIVTGGMYILAARCKAVTFSEPIYKMGDALLVPKGNPSGLVNYENIRDKGVTMVTGAGYAMIANAKGAGVDQSKIMEVPGPTEMLAAVQAGRAEVAAGTPVMLKQLADSSEGKLEVTDPEAMPKSTFNWGALAFNKADQDFVEKFNVTLKEYLGSEEMMSAVKKYGYEKQWLPGEAKTDWICANR